MSFIFFRYIVYFHNRQSYYILAVVSFIFADLHVFKINSLTWNLVTHCELQKLRMFPSGNVAWYCGKEFLLQK